MERGREGEREGGRREGVRMEGTSLMVVRRKRLRASGCALCRAL